MATIVAVPTAQVLLLMLRTSARVASQATQNRSRLDYAAGEELALTYIGAAAHGDLKMQPASDATTRDSSPHEKSLPPVAHSARFKSCSAASSRSMVWSSACLLACKYRRQR
jgi:hypothetical protein